MPMPSLSSVAVVALDSAGKKRLRGGSFDQPIKKFKGWSARLSSSLQSTMPLATSSIAGSTTFSNKIRPKAPLKENDSGAATMVPNLTTGVNSTAQQLEYQYRHRERIIGARKSGSWVYVFPKADACISVDHYNRFPVIVDIFRQNLQECDQIALKHPAKTEFKVKMCGTSMEDAKPSILINHPQADKKMRQRIQGVLNRPQVQQQYCSSDMVVRFDIYWFNGPEYDLFGRSMDGLSIQMQNSNIPGALLSDDACSNVSTLTCGIRFRDVDDAIFVLTTAHAFEEDDESSEGDTEHAKTSGSISLALNEDEDEDEDIFWFGGVEYDMTELRNYYNTDKDDQVPQVNKQHKDLSRHVQGQSDGLVQITEAKVVVSPNRVWGRSQEPEWENHPNLDWALIEIGKSTQWNMYDPQLAMHDIPGLGYQRRDVEVITSRGSFYGTISSIPSFIANSNKLSSLCKVWSVSLADPSQISVGDSGALVIDCLTESPYGYVIGINHFQELYVIPLHSVLEQIWQMMPNSTGSPEILMALVPHRAHVPFLLPKDGKDSGLARHLSQYWPRTEAHNMKTSFHEVPWVEGESFDTTSSTSFYVDCPTSPIHNHPSEEDTQHTLPSLTTSFTSYHGRTQSPHIQPTTASQQILDNSIDLKNHSLNSSNQSFEDVPPSSYRTAELEHSVEKSNVDFKLTITDNKSGSAPVSPQ
ncbi:hypothetical protein V8C42DRAFT_330433 [Trichoderma barbatum]